MKFHKHKLLSFTVNHKKIIWIINNLKLDNCQNKLSLQIKSEAKAIKISILSCFPDEEFNLLLKCLLPYTNLIVYPKIYIRRASSGGSRGSDTCPCQYSPNWALKFFNQFRRNGLKNQFEKRRNRLKRCTNSILLKFFNATLRRILKRASQ